MSDKFKINRIDDIVSKLLDYFESNLNKLFFIVGFISQPKRIINKGSNKLPQPFISTSSQPIRRFFHCQSQVMGSVCAENFTNINLQVFIHFIRLELQTIDLRENSWMIARIFFKPYGLNC